MKIASILTSSRIVIPCLLFMLTTARSAPVETGRRNVGPSHLISLTAARQHKDRLPAGDELTLAIGLSLRNQPELATLIHDLYDPANPKFHQYLTCEAFTERFGPSAEDYESVMLFARTNSLTVVKTHRNRVLVDVRGKVADIERAFGVRLFTYHHSTNEAQDFYAPDTEPTVDAQVPILAVRGLENYDPPRPLHHNKRPLGNTPDKNTDGGTGPSGTYIGKDFRNAYAPGVTNTGAGQIVGLFEQDGYYASDISFYESLAGLPSVTLSNVVLGGFSGNPTTNVDQVEEVSLDIEMAIAMAPGLSQVRVYEAPTGSVGAYDILNQMATDNLAKQLSSSWVIDRIVSTPVPDQLFQEFAAQGQSFFQSSGDQDAYAPGIYQIAGNPNITIVGGTELSMTTNAGGTWASETVWQAGVFSGTGGGISTAFAIPDYQLGINMATNLGSTAYRNVPDVALTADNIYLRAGNGLNLGVGGTSAATPLWAGFMALVNQQAVSQGKPTVGFINPAIYALGQSTNYTNCFHDITTGNNTNGLSPTNFFAVPGYDLCTGWGTPAGSNLINALSSPAVAPAFTYWTNNGTITITRYGGAGGAVTIPGTINGFPVTSIGDYAFYEWTGVSSITVPSSVTNIGADAFAECPSLASVFFTGNAPVLDGTNVFGANSSAVVYYEVGASGWSSTFGGRPASLWSPEVPCALSLSGGMLTIGQYLGSGGAVTIPSSIGGYPVGIIGGFAFAGSSITSITIPSSVFFINDWAFYGCFELTSVYCEGNAPSLGGPDVFIAIFEPPFLITFDPAVVFYEPTTSGWSSSYGGLPAVPLYVSNTSDNGAAGSLRQAIGQAPAGWTLTFDSSLSGQTILLTNGQINVNNNLSIDASALGNGIIINGNHSSRIFNVGGGVSAQLKSVTLSGGSVTGGNSGGAIYNTGTLTLTNCTLSGDSTDSNGTGGAIFNSGQLGLAACTLSGNSAGFAGALANYGNCTLANCTFNGNSAPHNGGAVDNPYGATLSVLQCTFVGNSAGGAGGAIDNYLSQVYLTNTIVAGNTSQDIYNWLDSQVNAGGTNIVQALGNAGILTGAGSILAVAPNLATLGGYGGPTATMPPLPGSPAINAGSAAAAAGLAVDQRGLPRLAGANVDIGAVELQTPFPIVTTANDSGADSLRQLVGAADVSATITFATNLSGQTILLSSGAISLNNNLVIDASGLANGIQLNGNNADRIFNVAYDATVVLNSLTITNGLNNGNGGTFGGGIENGGTLTLNKCTVAGNSAGLNANFGFGGGIENNGSLTANESTFAGNLALGGGAIASQGPALALNQCTISGNTDFGGYAPGGGGILVALYLAPTITNSIVAGNLSSGSPGDISVNASVQGAYDLVGVGGGLVNGVNGNQVGVTNPALMALGNYGGPTPTMLPFPGSPAIGAGSVAAAGAFGTDQRGLPRVVGGHVDIGAVEVQQISASGPPLLMGLTLLTNRSLQFRFTNTTGASFTVFAATNAALHFNQWSNLGTAAETPPGSGRFYFTDTQATNYPRRFYRVRSP